MKQNQQERRKQALRQNLARRKGQKRAMSAALKEKGAGEDGDPGMLLRDRGLSGAMGGTGKHDTGQD